MALNKEPSFDGVGKLGGVAGIPHMDLHLWDHADSA